MTKTKEAATEFLRSVADDVQHQRYGGLSLFDRARCELDPSQRGAAWSLVVRATKAARTSTGMAEFEVLLEAAQLIEDGEVAP